MSYGGWPPYVPVAQRRARAAREIAKLQKKGMIIEPIAIQGRKIARTFWGEAWCRHLEAFSDYQNRLPRGRTYVRNGSVCHLALTQGHVEAIVSGSELYRVNISITPLPVDTWEEVKKHCAGQIGSLLELLQGRFSDNVMAIVTDRQRGLFPTPSEITLACDCPDGAVMCKHVAAALYGVGARLDDRPELLFLLRNVSHEELISAELALPSAASGPGKRRRLAGADLADIFGVDMEERVKPVRRTSAVSKKAGKQRKKTFRPTAAAVRRLRKRFGMNTSQFAKLVGVSPPTVSNWEKARGTLNLRQRTGDALTRVAQYTPEQAERELMRGRRGIGRSG